MVEEIPLEKLDANEDAFRQELSNLVKSLLPEDYKVFLGGWGQYKIIKEEHTYSLPDNYQVSAVGFRQLETSEIAIRNLPASARSKKAISDCAQEHAPPFRAAVLDITKKGHSEALSEGHTDRRLQIECLQIEYLPLVEGMLIGYLSPEYKGLANKLAEAYNKNHQDSPVKIWYVN